MSAAGAFATIGAWTLAGSVTALGLDYEAAPSAGKLPCTLIEFPENSGRLGLDEGALAADDGYAWVALDLLLLVKTLGEFNHTVRGAVPSWLDAVITQVQIDPLAAANVALPLRISAMTPGVVVVHGAFYFGVRTRLLLAVR